MGKRKKPTGGKEMETTAVTKRETNAVTHYDPAQVAAPHIGANDLIIPKILPIHHMSEKAKDRNNEAEPGEFRDTIENKLIGSLDKPFSFVPIHMTIFWAVYDMTEGGQGKFIETFPVDASNENLKVEDTVNGTKIKRVKTFECYCLLPDELATGSAFPYVLSFRITSSKAGKTLATQMYVRNKMANKMPYEVVCEVSLTEESNDHGDFFVQHVRPLRPATKEEILEAQKWHQMIASGQVKKDDSDLTMETTTPESVNSEKF